MLTRPDGGDVVITFEGREIRARAGDSVAAALLAAGVAVTRTSHAGAPRGPYCMMGACFDCLAEVDGVGNVQTCMVEVRPGLRVARQDGSRALADDGEEAA